MLEMVCVPYVVCDELNDCVWNLVLWQFTDWCVCICIVSKAVFISSAPVIVRAGGAIWLNPFATMFNVCSAVTCCRVLCFVPVLRWCVWYVCCYVREKAFLQCLCNY